MAGLLQLTDQLNPLAQTFRVTEPGGSVLTGIGIFFQKAPAASDPQLPITVELRPTTAGMPSARRFIPGTRVSKSAADVRSAASDTFSSATEVKFTFTEPVYIPTNTEIAIVIATSAMVGHYKVWKGTIGEHVAGSTTKLVSQNLNSGAMFQSANGTVWSPDQYSDLAFKVYRAKFSQTHSLAHFEADVPPMKALTENTYTDNLVRYPSDPLRFEGGTGTMNVIHPGHGFIVGDKVKIRTTDAGFDSSDTINGVSGANILKTHTITGVDAFGYSVDLGVNSTASVRAGGTGVLASEQYVMDEFKLTMPRQTPPKTSIRAFGYFTTTKSLAGNETAYTTTSNATIDLDAPMVFKNPHVIASHEQEVAAARLNGEPSTTIKVVMQTSDKYNAPYINASAASLKTLSNFIDYQDSDNSLYDFTNQMVTVDHAAETEPEGGTHAAKHITIPFSLEDVATSIRVMVDAFRPDTTDFNVWYRTAKAGDETPINEKNWVAFSNTINSNYSDKAAGDIGFEQYEFNVYDISDFDTYQIKITMSSRRSTMVPKFRNLRTIATV